MNSVERVKAICKERGIPISKLERELGYSNAYISQLRKGKFPADRLHQIAEYLNVSPEYLMTGEETKKAPGTEAEGITDEQLKFALFGDAAPEISDAQLNDVKRYAKFIMDKE